jgi:SPP1 gp7 family putative phage head morphogenesis protein
MKFQNISKAINKALSELGVNPVINRLERSKEAKKTENLLQAAIAEQISKPLTTQTVGMAFQLTRKAEANLYITNLYRNYVKTLDEEALQTLEALMRTSAISGGNFAFDLLGKEDRFTLNEEQKNAISLRRSFVEESIYLTTLAFLAIRVENAKSDGLSVEETIDYIKKDIPSVSKNRSKLIVTNEIAEASSGFEYEVFKDSGVTVLRWVTALDERVCPWCSGLHGETISTGNKFNVAAKETNYAREHPPIHIGCRCWLDPVEVKGVPLK